MAITDVLQKSGLSAQMKLCAKNPPHRQAENLSCVTLEIVRNIKTRNYER